VYEGHRVMVKVTGAKKVQNCYSCNEKLRSAILEIRVLQNRDVMAACSTAVSGTSGVNAIFVT